MYSVRDYVPNVPDVRRGVGKGIYPYSVRDYFLGFGESQVAIFLRISAIQRKTGILETTYTIKREK